MSISRLMIIRMLRNFLLKISVRVIRIQLMHHATDSIGTVVL